MDIEIMYADLNVAGNWKGTRSRVRVPVADAPTLLKVGVLFMIFSDVTTEAKAQRHIDGVPVRRVREVFGGDYYAFLNSGPYYLLWPWDDRNFAWVDVAIPFADYSIVDPRDPEFDKHRSYPVWLPPEATVFEGFTLPNPDWAVALAEFQSEMH